MTKDIDNEKMSLVSESNQLSVSNEYLLDHNIDIPLRNTKNEPPIHPDTGHRKDYGCGDLHVLKHM